MINPNVFEPSCKRWNNSRFAGGKSYIPVLIGNGRILRTRKTFKRASEASDYATRVLACWKRVYGAWVAVSDQRVAVPQGDDISGQPETAEPAS